jgi:hypothetical protein
VKITFIRLWRIKVYTQLCHFTTKLSKCGGKLGCFCLPIPPNLLSHNNIQTDKYGFV